MLYRKNCPIVVGDVDVCQQVLGDSLVLKTVHPYKLIRYVHGQLNDTLASEGDYWRHSGKGMAHVFASQKSAGRMELLQSKRRYTSIENGHLCDRTRSIQSRR